MTEPGDTTTYADARTGSDTTPGGSSDTGPVTEDPAARRRADALQRRLDAVQALLAEERRDAEAAAAQRLDEEPAALREELARLRAQVAAAQREAQALRSQLAAAQREARALRASSTFRAGLVVKRLATPLLATRRAAARRVRPLVRAAVRRQSNR